MALTSKAYVVDSVDLHLKGGKVILRPTTSPETSNIEFIVTDAVELALFSIGATATVTIALS